MFIGQLGKRLKLPKPNGRKTTVRDAIYDLPFIASGEGQEESKYDKAPLSEFQKRHCVAPSTFYTIIPLRNTQKRLLKN